MKRRALVFDDDEVILSLFTSLLENRGYEVHTYANPLNAPLFPETGHLCSLESTCSDVIISDVNMPGMTGLELIEALKKNGCTVRSMALMSGYWSKIHREKAEKLGCKVFQKPFRITDVLSWLEECEQQIPVQRKLVGLSLAG